MLDDFVYVCDDAYSKDDIMRKEREMISTVGYDVGYPLSYRFLRRYGRVKEAPQCHLRSIVKLQWP